MAALFAGGSCKPEAALFPGCLTHLKALRSLALANDLRSIPPTFVSYSFQRTTFIMTIWRRPQLLLCLLMAGVLAACGGDTNDSDPTDAPTPEEPSNNDGENTDSNNEDPSENNNTGEDPEEPEDPNNSSTPDGPDDEVKGGCLYANPFASTDDCLEFVGQGWTVERMEEACSDVLGQEGTWIEGGCGFEQELGSCWNDVDETRRTRTVSSGDDPESCAITQTGCEVFSGGTFIPGNTCYNSTPGTGGGGGGNVFVLPYERCQEPLEGEPAGDGPDGQVCTKVAIQGATEEGRRFEDYASCEDVLTQRPYWSNPKVVEVNSEDPRLEDEAYQAESNWVRAQIEASSCVCCHSTSITPEGVGQWDTEAGPLWVDTFADTGLAMMAGWVDSTGFGAYPPEDNNGFDRYETGAPTTDIPRMKAFFEGELTRRGLERADFDETPPFGGFLLDLIYFEPEACEDGLGVARDGTASWSGSAARYLYILEGDSLSPGVPPNFDIPEGALYRLNVSSDAAPIESGFNVFAPLEEGRSLTLPATPEDLQLVEGETYYMAVFTDMTLPAMRCTFEY